MVFYNFCYYFWGQHCYCPKTGTIGKDFCFLQVSIALNSFTASPALPLFQRPCLWGLWGHLSHCYEKKMEKR